MATVANNSYQASEHQINIGKTTLPAKWTWNADNTSHAAGEALSAIEAISGAARIDGFSTRAVRVRIAFTTTSGTPVPKECRLSFFSKSGIPATTPVVSTAQAFINTDAPYLLGSVDVATADWLVLGQVASVEKTVAIDCINEDTTIGTIIYTYLLNTVTTWTPPASSKFEVTVWFEMN